jgi:NADH:ubiquinone oxidoreductase subunit 3 (subunit A)
MPVVFSPLVAFLIYAFVVVLLLVLARSVAARGKASESKTATYSSGEAAPSGTASPGYRPFFMVAFFFAILHLGVLIVGSGGFTAVTGVYILGLVVSLVALALG